MTLVCVVRAYKEDVVDVFFDGAMLTEVVGRSLEFVPRRSCVVLCESATIVVNFRNAGNVVGGDFSVLPFGVE